MRNVLIPILALTGLLACGPDTSSSSGSSSGDTGSSSSSSGSASSSGGTSSSMCTPDTWSNFAQAFFSNECSNCHHHTGEFGTISFVSSVRSSISTRISSGNMPQGSSLNGSDKQRIIKWLSCTPLQ